MNNTASASDGVAAINGFLAKVVVQIVDPIIELLAAAAFVLFLWGVFKMIANAGDETAREEGRRHILYGIIGLAIIFGVFGILNLITGTLGVPSVTHYGP
jgi:hypothetical protein